MSLAALGASASDPPSLSDVRHAAFQLAGRILETPVWRWRTGVIAERLPAPAEVWLKLELFQRTGSFKLRGVLMNLHSLDDDQRRRGVVAASAGNHAMTVAHAARLSGCSAVLVMPSHASPVRIAACRAEGGEVRLTGSLAEAFEVAPRLAAEQGRTMIHPFEGPLTAQGTGTVGLELMHQVPRLDAVVVPVGGGGLLGGIAATVKQLDPQCRVYGVEPFGADAMYRSFEAGRPVALQGTRTLADSLAVPAALPFSHGVCRRFADAIVRVSDDELCAAMHHLYRDMKLVAEPAAAASTAALLGPLRERLQGRRVGLVVCGSNIDAARFAELVARGAGINEAAMAAA